MSEHAATSASLPRRHRWGLIVAAAVLLFTAAAVAAAVYAQRSETAQTNSPVGVSAGPHIGFTKVTNRTAPNFVLPDLQSPSRQLSLNSFHKPLLINFWQSGCIPCQQETPALVAVSNAEHGRVTFVGIDTYDIRSSALSFAHAHKVSYPLLFDPQGQARLKYDIPGFPTTFFVSSKGQIVGEQIGAMSKTQLEHLLSQLFPNTAHR